MNNYNSISIRDTFTRRNLRENFYQGFVLGLLNGYPDVQSNPEAGDGYPDILVLDRIGRRAAILELKYARSDDLPVMEDTCRNALEQIENRRYDSLLVRSGLFTTIRKYGISFHNKLSCVRQKDPARCR